VRPRCVALAVFVVLLGTVASDAAASPIGTVSGTLKGVSVPPANRGAVVLTALRLDRGTVGAARRVGRSGAYTLRLPPGPYALFGIVVDRTATATVSTRGPLVSLRAGQRRKVPLRLRKPKYRHKKRHHKAKAAYFQEDGTQTPGNTAYQIQDFTGATGELAIYNRGLPGMLATDTFEKGGCPTTQVASPRDQQALAAELQLQQSPYFDPSTRVRRNWILPDVKITGRLANRPGGVAYSISVVDARTGVIWGTVIGELEVDANDFLDHLAALGAAIMAKVCNPPPPAPPAPQPTPPPPPAVDPDGLTGTFTGDVDYMTQPLTPLPIRVNWSGNLDLVREPYGFLPFVMYDLRSGSVTATVHIDKQSGGCQFDGTSTLDLVAVNFGQHPPMLSVDLTGAAPVYRVTLGAGNGQIDMVASNCDDPMRNGEHSPYPLAATPLAWTLTPLPVLSRYAFNDTVTGSPDPSSSPIYHWTWALSGA
jgi:hypothetical protein